jgi:hypothetical protein
VTPAALPGIYKINVTPVQSKNWKAGVYIFAVAVELNGDQGQALTSVLLD